MPLALGLEPNERYEAAREGLSDLRPVRLAPRVQRVPEDLIDPRRWEPTRMRLRI